MTRQTDNHAPNADAKPETAPKRKPWIPPRFEGIDASLGGVKNGKSYFDNDDAQNPGGRLDNPDVAVSPTWTVYDQTNPYNS